MLTKRMGVGYRERFRSLLALVRPRRLEFGVELLVERMRARSECDATGLPRAFAELYEFTRVRVARRLEVTGECALVAPPWLRFAADKPPRFSCDASLGALARWLRAAGYAAVWSAERTGGEALRLASGAGGVFATTDSGMLAPITRAGISGLWVPGGLDPVGQLGLVLREFGLPLRAPRCMPCGGELEVVEKERVRERIPPRTAAWKDEYFVCTGCDRLFWKGTHWQRIERRLRAASAGPASSTLIR